MLPLVAGKWLQMLLHAEVDARISSGSLDLPQPIPAAGPGLPAHRDLIAGIVIQYLTEARAEPIEDVSFSTPLMDAGLDSLDMLKVQPSLTMLSKCAIRAHACNTGS